MFNSFSKLEAISQEKFYSPLLNNNNQGLIENSRFLSNNANNRPGEELLKEKNNFSNKSFTPFNHNRNTSLSSNNNGKIDINTLYYNNSVMTSSDLTFQSSLLNSYTNEKDQCLNNGKNIYERLNLLSKQKYMVQNIQQRKISQEQIKREIDRNLEDSSFNFHSLKDKLINSNTSRKRIGFIKKTNGIFSIPNSNSSLRFLKKKRKCKGVKQFLNKMSQMSNLSTINERSNYYNIQNKIKINSFMFSPLKPRPIKLNDDSESFERSNVKENRNQNAFFIKKIKKTPGRRPKADVMKIFRVFVSKVFYKIFTLAFSEIPPCSFNRRAVNRINKYIHFQDIIKNSEPIVDFSNLFNGIALENEDENYTLIRDIKLDLNLSFSNRENCLSDFNLFAKISGLAIDMLNPSISSECLSGLLTYTKYLNDEIKFMPVIKLDAENTQSTTKTKKFMPFIVLNKKSKNETKCEKINEAEKNVKIETPITNFANIIAETVEPENKLININADDDDMSSSSIYTSLNESSEESDGEETKENNNIECKLCNKYFVSTCALGGHMSRKHANSSEKYKAKIETRKKREENRDSIKKGRILFLSKFNLDYNILSKSPEGRRKMRILMKEKSIVYKECLKEVK